MPRTAPGVADPRSAICSCEHERALTHDAELVLTPDASRWRSWTGPLTGLVAELAEGPAHTLILSQPGHGRWVEVLIGHGELRVEVPGNSTLPRSVRLDADEERRLAALGFHGPGQLHSSWRLEEAIGLPERATELVVHVLVEVLGLDPQAPLVVDRFGADRPCRACAWAA